MMFDEDDDDDDADADADDDPSSVNSPPVGPRLPSSSKVLKNILLTCSTRAKGTTNPLPFPKSHIS